MFAIGSKKWNGLAKLSEESGEVVQVIGKLTATGGEAEHWDGTNLRDRLIEEIGDVLAACVFVGEYNGFIDEIGVRAATKLTIFRQWNESQQLTTEFK